jgi:hypothetical protein
VGHGGPQRMKFSTWIYLIYNIVTGKSLRTNRGRDQQSLLVKQSNRHGCEHKKGGVPRILTLGLLIPGEISIPLGKRCA